jgi:hypothetical protein
MARPTIELIQVLRATAERLSEGALYQWSHQGSCNCGHLAQTVTNLSKAEIHAYALQKAGDWGRKSIDYCPDSGYPIDLIISQMMEIGLSTDDLYHLERLSAPKILKKIPRERRPLMHNRREDVILYLNAWVDMLEEELLESIEIPEFEEMAETVFF